MDEYIYLLVVCLLFMCLLWLSWVGFIPIGDIQPDGIRRVLMPRYKYRCDKCGGSFELVQGIKRICRERVLSYGW